MSTELTQALWAVIATVLASACTGLWQYYRLRHRIAYRVQLNIPISIIRDGPGGAVRLRPPGTGPRTAPRANRPASSSCGSRTSASRSSAPRT